MKKEKKKNNIIIIIIMIISSIFLILSTTKIVIYYLSNKGTEDIIEELQEKEIITLEKDEDTENYNVDFTKLKEYNSDTVAYIRIPGSNINFVVVKAKNNSYYLNHNFNKKYSAAGWVFADYRNKIDETDKNIIIYGHNMKNGSMFGPLKDALKKEWYTNKDNLTIELKTPYDTYNYQVFSIYSIEPEDYYITTNFTSNKTYKEFLKKIKSRSIYNFNIDLTEYDRILTLSTCTNDGKKRIVIHAKLT